MKKQMSRNPKLKQFPHGLGCEKASVAISNGKFESHKKHKTSKTIKKNFVFVELLIYFAKTLRI